MLRPYDGVFVRLRRRCNEPCADRSEQELVRAIDDFIERAGARKHGLRLRQQLVACGNPAGCNDASTSAV